MALHYHNVGYDSDNEYWLPGPFMRPVHVYLVSTTETSFNPKDNKEAKYTSSAFTPRWLRNELPFFQAVHQWLAFGETTPSEMDSEDEGEDFSTTEIDDPVWSEEPIPNRQQLCIHQVPCHTPRPASTPQQPIYSLILTLGHRMCLNSNREMRFEFRQ